MRATDQLLPILQGSAAFRTTRWSLVLRAGCPEGERAAEALEQLCRAYWYPLYVYARRRGKTPEDAQDLIQGFLSQLIARNDLANVAPANGRFRSFLLAALNHYISNDWKRGQARKRGGGYWVVSMDDEGGEENYLREPIDPVTPETLFERQWARTVLNRVLERLRCEQVAAEKGGQFEELKGFLSEKKVGSRAEIAAHHGVAVNTVDVAICRLRKRYAELLREEIAQTVSRTEEIEDEIRHLIAMVAEGQQAD